MILGFVRQGYVSGVDGIKYRMTRKPGTFNFSNREESPWGYSSYPANLKKLFTDLEQMCGVLPVLSGDVLQLFFDTAEGAEDNPNRTS